MRSWSTPPVKAGAHPALKPRVYACAECNPSQRLTQIEAVYPVATAGTAALSSAMTFNSEEGTRAQYTILFDGVCAFCNFWVKFVVARDPQKKFQFAALQSEVAQNMLRSRGVTVAPLSSIIVLTSKNALTRSDAVLEILRGLGPPWSALFFLRYIPRIFRNSIYDAVARARYRLFGKYDQCPVPSADMRSRFLDQS